MKRSFKMKAIIVSLFLIGIICQSQARSLLDQSLESSTDLDKDELDCVSEFRINKEKIKKINLQDLAPEDDPDFNKFVGCTCKKKGFLKSNGKMNWTAVKNSLLKVAEKDPDHSEAIYHRYEEIITISVDICRRHPPQGATVGETAIKSLNCIAEHVMEAL